MLASGRVIRCCEVLFLFLFGVREDLCIKFGNYKSYRDIVHTTTRETTPSEALILLASQQFLLKPAPQKNSNVNTGLPQKYILRHQLWARRIPRNLGVFSKVPTFVATGFNARPGLKISGGFPWLPGRKRWKSCDLWCRSAAMFSICFCTFFPGWILFMKMEK